MDNFEKISKEFLEEIEDWIDEYNIFPLYTAPHTALNEIIINKLKKHLS